MSQKRGLFLTMFKVEPQDWDHTQWKDGDTDPL